MATLSSILAWRISWTEEPGELQSTGSQRVGHDKVTNTFTFTVAQNSVLWYFKLVRLQFHTEFSIPHIVPAGFYYLLWDFKRIEHLSSYTKLKFRTFSLTDWNCHLIFPKEILFTKEAFGQPKERKIFIHSTLRRKWCYSGADLIYLSF